MQIIVEEQEARKVLRALVCGLSRDVHSWRGWRVFFSPAQATRGMQQEDLTATLAALLSSYDGAVVWTNGLCLAIYNQDDARDDDNPPDDVNEFMSFELPPLMAYDLSDDGDRGHVLKLIDFGCSAVAMGEETAADTAGLKGGVPRFEELLKIWERTSTRPSERVVQMSWWLTMMPLRAISSAAPCKKTIGC